MTSLFHYRWLLWHKTRPLYNCFFGLELPAPSLGSHRFWDLRMTSWPRSCPVCPSWLIADYANLKLQVSKWKRPSCQSRTEMFVKLWTLTRQVSLHVMEQTTVVKESAVHVNLTSSGLAITKLDVLDIWLSDSIVLCISWCPSRSFADEDAVQLTTGLLSAFLHDM